MDRLTSLKHSWSLHQWKRLLQSSFLKDRLWRSGTQQRKLTLECRIDINILIINFDRCVVWGTWWRKGLWDWLCWFVSYVQQSYCCSSKNVMGMSFTLGGFRETSPESIKIVYGSQPTVIFLIVYSTLLLLSDFSMFYVLFYFLLVYVCIYFISHSVS